MKNNPLISVIIVNYNGKKWLEGCLSSLKDQTYKNSEVILVDNASIDGSVAFVKNNLPKVKIVKSRENLGFAGGNNLGYKSASGELIVLLNNDTKVDKNYLADFVKSTNTHPDAGIIQSSILLEDKPGIIDSCGSMWTDTSFLYYIGNSKSFKNKKYTKPFKVFSVKGASMLIKRELIEKVGLFDPDFWNYYEETDLCQRAWIAGYEVWYDPAPLCYHTMGGTSLKFDNDYIQLHNFKNKLASIIKNFQFPYLLIYIINFLFFNFLIGLYWLFKGKYKHSIALMRAISWNIINLSETLEKRILVQKTRVTKDYIYLRKVKKNPKINYYINLLNDSLEKYQD